MLTDFDKVLAGQARNPERFYIVGFHRSEFVVGAVDKPGETVARLCGHTIVVDEDMMAHTKLGSVNLLTAPHNTSSTPTTTHREGMSSGALMEFG